MLQDDKSTTEKSKEKSEQEKETDKDSKTEKDIDESEKKVTSGRLRRLFYILLMCSVCADGEGINRKLTR